jgi:hypothetical protein
VGSIFIIVIGWRSFIVSMYVKRLDRKQKPIQLIGPEEGFYKRKKTL